MCDNEFDNYEVEVTILSNGERFSVPLPMLPFLFDIENKEYEIISPNPHEVEKIGSTITLIGSDEIDKIFKDIDNEKPQNR